MVAHRLSGRPLLGNRLDAGLFTGRRRQLEHARRAVLDRLNTVITGEPGAGRTSTLHVLLAELTVPHVLIRGAPVLDAGDLLRRVVADLQVRAGTGAGLPDLGASGDVVDRIGVLRQLAGAIDALVIAVDDVPPEVGMDLFGRYRDELWSIDAAWLVTVTTAHAPLVLRPPADVFFDVRIDLPALSDTEAADLLDKRIGGATDRLGIDRVISVAAGNPRRLIALARQLGSGDQGEFAAAADAGRRRSGLLAGMTAASRMLAGELEALGGASASDPALLARLGWTRPRAVQVLKELEAAGLVVATDERRGKGRPRKVYRLSAEPDISAET